MIRLTCYILVFLITVPAGGAAAQTYTVEEIGGVRHVHNLDPVWGDNSRVKLSYFQQIGKLEDKDENYLFYRPGCTAKDRDGNIYIVDRGNYRIQKFNIIGNYIATFGRQGQGPGEFELPTYLQFDADGDMWISDFRKMAILELDPSGDEKRRIRFMNRGIQFMRMDMNRFWLTDSGNILVKGSGDSASVYIFDPSGHHIRTIGEPFPDDSDLRHFSITIDNKDNVYLIYGARNRIVSLTAEGKKNFVMDRPLNFEESDKKRYRVGGRIVDKLPPGGAETIYNVVSFASEVDGANRLWVPTRMYSDLEADKVTGPKTHFEIFSETGVLLGYVPRPDVTYTLYNISGNSLFCIDLKNMVIHEYRIVENKQ